MLNMVVFGESVLNDGVAIVFYRIAVALAYQQRTYGTEFDFATQFFMGLLTFFVVFLGGLIVGLIHGVFAAFVTRFLIPSNAQIIEPFLILLIGYMSYLVAEGFRFSGIVAIMTYVAALLAYSHRCILGVAGRCAGALQFPANHNRDSVGCPGWPRLQLAFLTFLHGGCFLAGVG